MSDMLPTIKVKREGGRGYRLINLSAFDPLLHEPFDGGSDAAAAPVPQPQSHAAADPAAEPRRKPGPKPKVRT